MPLGCLPCGLLLPLLGRVRSASELWATARLRVGCSARPIWAGLLTTPGLPYLGTLATECRTMVPTYLPEIFFVIRANTELPHRVASGALQHGAAVTPGL